MISVERFTSQPVPRQLGALAANLARIASCARWPEPSDVVVPMMAESIQFIEWIAPHTAPQVIADLVDLQVMLGFGAKVGRTQKQIAHNAHCFPFRPRSGRTKYWITLAC